MNVPFLLDSSLSVLLKSSFRGATVEKITECGLQQNADDMDVIDLASRRRAILVTTDNGIVDKCKAYQKQHGCLYGLFLLPDGFENQRRILDDFKGKRKRLRFHKIDQPLSWAKIRDYNFLVRAQLLGHPHVLELCDCKAWEE
jgi:hypothetical protein